MCDCVEKIINERKKELNAVQVSADKFDKYSDSFSYRLYRKDGKISSITKHSDVFYKYCPYCGKKLKIVPYINDSVATIATLSYGLG